MCRDTVANLFQSGEEQASSTFAGCMFSSRDAPKRKWKPDPLRNLAGDDLDTYLQAARSESQSVHPLPASGRITVERLDANSLGNKNLPSLSVGLKAGNNQPRLASVGEFLVENSLFVKRHFCFHVLPHAFFDVLLDGFATSERA